MGGSSGGGATQTQTSQYKMSPQQQAVFNSTFPYLEKAASDPKTYQPYTGQTYAAPNSNQTSAWQGYLSAMPALQSQADQAAKTQTFLQTKAPYVESNPYLQQAIQAAITPENQNFQNVVMPSLRMQGVATGQAGSSREGVAQALAANFHDQNVANTTATMSSQGYQTGLNAMLQGLNMAPQTAAMQLLAPSVQEAVGTAQQQASQAGLNDAANRYYTQHLYPVMVAQQLLQSVYGVPGGSTENTGTTRAGSGSKVMGGLGGAASGAALGAAAGSVVPVIGTALGALIGAAAGGGIGAAAS